MSRTDIKEMKEEVLNKLDEVLDNTGVNELLGKKKKEEENKNTLLWILADRRHCGSCSDRLCGIPLYAAGLSG